MKELIDKIEFDEKSLEAPLQWLSESKINGLADFQTGPIIRYLLKKVIELEDKLNDAHKQ